jgi:hypothetical protein
MVLLLLNKNRLIISFIKFHIVHRSRSWVYALLTSTIVLVISASCVSKQPLDTEDVLTLGIILEYEFSPEEQSVAVLLPTNAIAPGSDAYMDIVRSDNIGNVGILVFDVETQETVARFDINSYTIENLRWSHHNNTLFYLDRGKDGAFLISWQLDTDEKEIVPFQHGGFDIAPDDLAIVAWDTPERVQTSNVLTFYTWPQLEYTDSLTLPDVKDIEEAQWSSDGSWLIINTSNGIFRLDLASQTLTQVDPIRLSNLDLNASDTLISYYYSSGIYSLQDRCIVKEFDDAGLEQLEWGMDFQVLYLVVHQTDKKQNILARLDLTDNALSCINE